MDKFLAVELINVDKWASKLKAVTNPKPFKNGKYTKDGLFSQQIFGPRRSYYCACRNTPYIGKRNKGKKCKRCGVEVTTTDTRRKTFAKIALPFPIFNPLFYFLAIKMKTSSKELLTNLLGHKETYYYNDKDVIVKLPKDTEPPEGVDMLHGIDGAKTYLLTLAESKVGTESADFILSHQESITSSHVIVIPPRFRPCNRDGSGKFIMDNINKIYNQILIRVNLVNKSPVDMTDTDNSDIYKLNFNNIQQYAIELYTFILDKLSKKNGLIRSNILGKRVDFSGRAVITPNPNLSLDECSIPYFMMLEIAKPQLTGYLVRRRIQKTYKGALDLIDDCIKNKDFRLFDEVVNYADDKYCVLNRQPTLHRLGMLGFKMRVTKGNTIEIPPLITAPFNADFDGDCLDGKIELLFEDKSIRIQMSDIQQFDYFKKSTEKFKPNGIHIQKFKPTCDMKIKAIDPKSGKVENKKVTEFFIHENIEMFKVHDSESRFEDFWSSYDHSLIVYDENTEEILKVSPKELLDNPTGRYLIQEKQ